MSRIAKFARLPWRRKVLLIRCWLSLNLTAVGLRLFSLPRILGFFGTNRPAAAVQPILSREEILWSIRAAAAMSWRPTCAVRALVAEQLLRQQGYPVQFKVGVLHDADFQAHAWVEDQSGVLIGESELPYQPLPEFPSRGVATPS